MSSNAALLPLPPSSSAVRIHLKTNEDFIDHQNEGVKYFPGTQARIKREFIIDLRVPSPEKTSFSSPEQTAFQWTEEDSIRLLDEYDAKG